MKKGTIFKKLAGVALDIAPDIAKMGINAIRKSDKPENTAGDEALQISVNLQAENEKLKTVIESLGEKEKKQQEDIELLGKKIKSCKIWLVIFALLSVISFGISIVAILIK